MPALHHRGMNSTSRHTTAAARHTLMALACTAALLPVHAADTSAAQQLQRWSSAAGTPGDPERGRTFFTSRHGGDWSCASCHGNPPTAPARHASTGKAIAPLAPAFHAARFTDTAKADKWFRRNCNDVLKRECSAGEKADMLAWLLQLDAKEKP